MGPECEGILGLVHGIDFHAVDNEKQEKIFFNKKWPGLFLERWLWPKGRRRCGGPHQVLASNCRIVGYSHLQLIFHIRPISLFSTTPFPLKVLPSCICKKLKFLSFCFNYHVLLSLSLHLALIITINVGRSHVYFLQKESNIEKIKSIQLVYFHISALTCENNLLSNASILWMTPTFSLPPTLKIMVVWDSNSLCHSLQKSFWFTLTAFLIHLSIHLKLDLSDSNMHSVPKILSNS